MKKTFTSLKAAMLFAALLMIGALAPEAKAQADVKWFIGQGTTTTNVAAATTNSYTGCYISKPRSANTAIVLLCSMSNATNSTVNFTFKPRDGGTNKSTVAAQWQIIPVVVQTNSRAEVSITNFNWGAIPVWELTDIGNTNGGAYVTNISGKVVTISGL